MYVCMLWSYYLVQVWPFEGLLSGPSLFFVNCLSKYTIKQGFQHIFCNQKVARKKNQGLLSGPSLRFLKCIQLGPDNNPYLDQLKTPQNVFLCLFPLKMCKNTYFIFIVFLKSNQKLEKKQNDNFSHFAKHRLIKKNRYVATPLLTKNWCFLTLRCFKRKH